MPNILSTLEGAFGFSETMVFCGLVKNEKNLPGPAEILKAFTGFPLPLGKTMWAFSSQVWIQQSLLLWQARVHECGQESLDLQMTSREAAKAAMACGRKSE